MGWEIIFLALAFLYAIKKAASVGYKTFTKRRAEKRVRKAHKSQLVTEALENDMAPRAAKRAAKAGAAAAVTVTTLEAMWIAFKNAWSLGWKQGKHRGHELRGKLPLCRWVEEVAEGKYEPCDEPAVDEQGFCAFHGDAVRERDEQKRAEADEYGGTKPAGEVAPPVTGTDQQQAASTPAPEGKTKAPNSGCDCNSITNEIISNLRAAGRCTHTVSMTQCLNEHWVPKFCGQSEVDSVNHLCADHSAAAGPEEQNDEPTRQNNGQGDRTTMPIETNSGGEILTKEQFVQEMEAIIQEETAELEDAQGDLKRAEEHMARIEVMAASLSNAQIDRATVEKVRIFIDSNSSRRDLARQRVAAAEQRRTNAKAALETLNASLQNTFYAA